jgi:ribosomal protein S18 acetylase RimI-like enzyme
MQPVIVKCGILTAVGTIAKETSVIRNAEIHELTELAEIYWAAWHWAFSKHFPPENIACVTLKDFEDRWRVFFGERDIRSFVYEHNGVPVGFITCSIKKDNPAEILSIMVTPTFIRSGIGSKLMEKALCYLIENKCSMAVLWVVNENFNARTFYERFGFSQTEEKRLIQRYGVELCQFQYEKRLQFHST